MIVPRGSRHVAAALFLLIAAAHVAALPADRAISQYVRRGWTVEQGLPHGTVRGIAQTADGYLWIATYEGLVRFNGDHFRILDRAANPELLSNSIITLCRTADGTLWLGTTSGLVRYRQGVFQTISLPGGPALINALTATRDGSVWVGTANGGLIRVSAGRVEAIPLPPPSIPITALAAAGDTIWIGTARGLARYRNDRLEMVSNDTIISLLADGDDTLYIGTAGGADRLQNGAVVHIPGLPADQVTVMHRDRDGNLWLGTYSSGVFRMSGDRISAYGVDDGLLNSTIRAIFEDDEGSIWIGSNGGLEQLRAGTFINWNERYGLVDSFVRAIFEDRDGVLWAGSVKGLNRFANGAWTKVDNPRIARILAIAQTRDGAYWFGTSSGLYRFANGTATLFTTAQGLSNNTVRDVHEDRRGDLWVATDFGVNRITHDGKVESFTGRGGLMTVYVMGIAETPDGRLWFATDGGLAEYNGTSFKLHSAPRELPSNHLFAIAAGRDGTVWVTTESDGLVRFRNEKASVITTRDGLAADKNVSIAVDPRGSLWLGTVRGAFRAPEAELNAIADGRRGTPLNAQLFDENDGLGSRQCNGAANPSVLRTRDGRIWFVTANGVSATAGNVAAPPALHVPVIERVVIDGKQMDRSALLEVRPGAERIEFEFSGLTFVTPERLRFRYRLHGYDRDWVDAGSNRVASYTNLPAGDYRFVLESSRDGLTWRVTNLPLVLQPHFYETRWFIALSMLAILALFWAIHSIRLHISHERARLLEKLVEERTHQISEEKERTEIALRAAEAAKREAERHERLTEEALAQAEEANRAKSIFLAATSHELRTPLNAIIGFSDILISHIAGKLDERYGRFLQNIHDSGQYLLGIINNILDLSKVEAGKMDLQPETILLREVVVGISAVMKGVTTLRKITIELDIPDDLPMIEADQTLVKQILYNLMSNAVKFSPERSTVTISARHLVTEEWPDDGAVEIRVIDRGIGIDAKDHELIFQEFRQAHGSKGRPEGTGLGLALVKRFVEMHSGTISVESERGRGSMFIVILPCHYSPAVMEEEAMQHAVGQR